jgi:hypothetical protein
VPLRISGSVGPGAKLAVYLLDPRPGAPFSVRVLAVPPGHPTLQVPITVVGNTLDDLPRLNVTVQVQPWRGIATGGYLGGATILDDDPSPTLTLTAVADRVSEDATLTWRMKLSGPSNLFVGGLFELIPPVGHPELSTDDVPADWLVQQGFEPPSPSVPLSGLGLVLFVDVELGRTSADLTIPTVLDTRTEPAERVVLRSLQLFGAEPKLPAGTRLVGVVSD